MLSMMSMLVVLSGGPETAAVLRSMEAHIGSRRTSTSIDVADFLSAWRCAAGPWIESCCLVVRCFPALRCLGGADPRAVGAFCKDLASLGLRPTDAQEDMQQHVVLIPNYLHQSET